MLRHEEARVMTFNDRAMCPVIRRDMLMFEPLVVVNAALFFRRSLDLVHLLVDLARTTSGKN